MACKQCKKVFRKDSRYLVYIEKQGFNIYFIYYRVDNEESDEYCPYCDNHYVLPAQEPQDSQNIDFAELLQEQLLQFNDPRMKAKFADFDEELEALMQE